MRPRVGFITFGQAPWVSLENLKFLQGKVLTELQRLPVDLHVVETIPTSFKDVYKAADLFRREDVDVVLAFYADYTNEEFTCVLASELKDYPLILFSSYGSSKSVIPVAAMITSAGNLKRLGKSFFHVMGEPTSREVMERVLRLCKAAAAARKIRRSIIGIVGSPNLMMVNTGYSEFHIRRIVPALLHLDTAELLSFLERVDEKDAEKVVNRVLLRVGKVLVQKKELINAAKTYLAIRGMMDKYGLDAITIREWPELASRSVTISLASSLLADDGVVCLSEADISSTITSLIMRLLADADTWIGEIESVDVEKNTVTLLHNCEAPFSLAETSDEITLTHTSFVEYFGNATGGVNVQLALKPGKVTMAKISGRPIGDRLKAMVTTGEVLRLLTPTSGGLSKAYVKFDSPLRDILDKWVEEGFEHHLIMVYTDVRQEFSAVCDILDIDKVTL